MPATKIDFKRELRELYAPSREPGLVDVPELQFAMIDGHGDPNVVSQYRDAVQALFAVAYAVRFALKGAPNGLDYGVMPLEGLWWVPDMAAFTIEDKSAWDWTAMIMQPEQVSAEVFHATRAAVAKKKPSLEALRRVRLERFSEGPAAQVLYRGAYADEGPTIRRLHAFIAEQGYKRAGKHHEIYLSDPGRTAPEKLKTIIRQPVVG
jgi:hypothetical protein